jgi:hypothetical protein
MLNDSLQTQFRLSSLQKNCVHPRKWNLSKHIIWQAPIGKLITMDKYVWTTAWFELWNPQYKASSSETAESDGHKGYGYISWPEGSRIRFCWSTASKSRIHDWMQVHFIGCMICFRPYHSSNSLKIPRHRILGVLFVTFSVSPTNYGPPWKEDPLSVMLPIG